MLSLNEPVPGHEDFTVLHILRKREHGTGTMTGAVIVAARVDVANDRIAEMMVADVSQEDVESAVESSQPGWTARDYALYEITTSHDYTRTVIGSLMERANMALPLY